jgi:AraC-like DNA-binding protein
MSYHRPKSTWAPNLLFHVHKPLPPLADFVEFVWYWNGPPPAHSKDRMMPDGCASLVVNLHEDRTEVYDREDPSKSQRMPGSSIAGPHSEHFIIDTREQQCVAGIEFKAGGLAPFIGMPAGELENRHVALEDLWGRAARLVRDELLEAPTPEARVRVLERSLLTRAGGRLARHPAVRFALAAFSSAPHVRTIGEVTSRIGLSPKRFIDVFREQVGLTPKRFCRVRRFQAVLERTAGGRPVNWADVALEGGYYDQAHFNRDFRAFSGSNPSAYLAQRGPFSKHVPLPE